MVIGGVVGGELNVGVVGEGVDIDRDCGVGWDKVEVGFLVDGIGWEVGRINVWVLWVGVIGFDVKWWDKL